MEKRVYFILGDLATNVLSGAVAAVVCVFIFGASWGMFPAMLLGMVVGMVVAGLTGVLLFLALFGAMEIMIPAMLTGMIVGMVMSMLGTMMTFTVWTAMTCGGLIGFMSFVMIYRLQSRISGDVDVAEAR